jgi:hypothetical protein
MHVIILCFMVGCLGKRLGPSLLGRRLDSNVISEPPLLLVYNCSIFSIRYDHANFVY